MPLHVSPHATTAFANRRHRVWPAPRMTFFSRSSQLASLADVRCVEGLAVLFPADLGAQKPRLAAQVHVGFGHVCPLLCPPSARTLRFLRDQRNRKTQAIRALQHIQWRGADVPQRFCKPKVGGSIPSSGTKCPSGRGESRKHRRQVEMVAKPRPGPRSEPGRSRKSSCPGRTPAWSSPRGFFSSTQSMIQPFGRTRGGPELFDLINNVLELARDQNLFRHSDIAPNKPVRRQRQRLVGSAETHDAVDVVGETLSQFLPFVIRTASANRAGRDAVPAASA